MQRFRFPRPAATMRVRLLAAACIMLGCGSATAQTAATPFADPLSDSLADPLAGKLQTDPRNPPRFQKFSGQALAQLGLSASFTPPAAGAGDTGFDSTNSRKVTTPKVTPQRKAQAIAPGLPQPVAVSPYQKPAKPGDSAYASAPATPPVPEIGPIRKPLSRRKAHVEPEDPYAPLGLRAGAFDLFPAVELIGGYETNPGHGPGGSGAALTTVAPELRAQSNWSRHELKADLRGSYTGYNPDETPTLSRPNFDGKVDGRIDVTRDTRIDLGSRVLVSTDNPGSPNLQAGLAKLPIFVTYGGTAGIGQRFNRFELSVKGDAERTAYQNSTLTDGSTASNADRNYDQYGGKLRGGYELSPGVTPFVELGADTRIYDLNTDLSGYQRDSKGVTGSAGTTFELLRVLTGEVSVGYAQRRYEDPRLADLGGLIGNASLVWNADALNTVKLSAASSVGESTVPGVPGVLYRDVGLQIDHAFRRWLIGSLKFGFGVDTYKNGATESAGVPTTVSAPPTPGETIFDRTDQRYSFGLGMTYKLNRMMQLKGEFRQDWLRSNVTGVDYASSLFLLGVRLQK